MENKRIVEVGGVKLELDMRYAKTIESYKPGDAVKVLIKAYSDTYNSYCGVILGFDAFVERPCITVAYLEPGYAGASMKMAYLTKDSKDIEIAPMVDDDELALTLGDVLAKLEKTIEGKKAELKDAEMNLDIFNRRMAAWFKQ